MRSQGGVYVQQSVCVCTPVHMCVCPIAPVFVKRSADGTSMHGVPHIINARSLTARVIWLVIVTGAFIMFFWQCGILLQRFYEFPKKVLCSISEILFTGHDGFYLFIFNLLIALLI